MLPKYGKWAALLVPLLYLGLGTFILDRDGYATSLNLLELYVNGGLVALVIAWLISRSNLRSGLDLTVLAAFAVYLLALHHLVTFIPVSYYSSQNFVGFPSFQAGLVNLIPLRTIGATYRSALHIPAILRQLVGNSLLLTPLAFSLLYLRITGSARHTLVNTFFTSVGIELTQLFLTFVNSSFATGRLSGRSTDIDDVILNTLSGVIGVLIYLAVNRLFLHRRPGRSSRPRRTRRQAAAE